MKSRQPIYKDLLQQDISEQHLTVFLQDLFTIENSNEPLKASDEINQPFLHNEHYYHTALCYASHTKNVAIVQALLSIGAHPNTYDGRAIFGSPLLLILRDKLFQINEASLSLLLAMPGMDIFETGPSGTTFDSLRSNTATISRLLKVDRQITSVCSNEVIDEMALSIASSQKDKTNLVVCQKLAKIYGTDKEIEEVKKTLTKDCKLSTGGAPLDSVILSFLFLPRSDSFKRFQSWYGIEKPSTSVSVEENRQQKSNCSMM